MSKNKISVEEKYNDLIKFRDLVLATLDYYLETPSMRAKSDDFDSNEHFELLKKQTLEHFNKGRLTTLKQWFRDLTEMEVESRNLEFNKYLQNKTKYDVDIFEDYFKRVCKIVVKGKITTDNQFYDIQSMVDRLCHKQPVDNERISILNKLLSDYEQRRIKKTGGKNA